MATVQQTLSLSDRMSPVLSKILSAMESTIDTMEQLNVAAGRGINPAAFSNVRTQINGARTAVNSLGDDIEQLDHPIDNARRGFSGWQAAIVTVHSAIGLVQQGVQAVGAVTGFFDSLSSTSSRLSLVKDEMMEQAELQDKIFESAERSRASYQETASAVAKLNLLAGNVFSGNEEAIAFSETLNKAFTVSGADEGMKGAAMHQLTQAMASGRLQGDEFNSIMENAPLVAQAIEDYMGVSRAELRELSSEGKISADIIKAAVFAASDDINAKFEEMPMKFGDHMTQLKNDAVQALQPLTERFSTLMESEQMAHMMSVIGAAIAGLVGWVDNLLDKIEQVAANPGFQQFASTLSTHLSIAAAILGWIINLAVTLVNAFMTAWPFLEPILYGVVTALLAYYGVMLAVNTITAVGTAITAIKAFIESVHAAATARSAGATFMATVAQHGLNAALLACPLTWIILIIIAVIAVIYAVIAAILKATDSTMSATSVILGALSAAAAFIGNLLLGLLDMVLGIINYMVNPILAFANFFANVFRDPIGSVIHLFGDMADRVLGIIESIASAIDKVFGSNLSGAVKGWRSGVSEWIDNKATQYGNGEYEKVVSALNLSTETFGLDRFAYSDAWKKGVSAGEKVDSKISDFTSGIFGGGDATDLEEQLKKYIPEDTGAGTGTEFDPEQYASGNAFKADVSGSEVEIANEDLTYLRDIAKQKYVNQYTSLRPTVTATFGDVRETADVNQIIQVLENAVTEAYSSSLVRG